MYIQKHPQAIRLRNAHMNQLGTVMVNVPTGFLKTISDLHDVGKFEEIHLTDDFCDLPDFAAKLSRHPNLKEKVESDPVKAQKEIDRFYKNRADVGLADSSTSAPAPKPAPNKPKRVSKTKKGNG
jgi:hypothetical protein